MLCAVVLLASRASAANILANSGFESGGTGWTVFGNGGNVFESQAPNHGGSKIYKNWGCWCADTNYNGVYQESPAAAGSTYDASGYVRSVSGDALSGANQLWLQVDFKDVGGNILEQYQSEHFTTASTYDVWNLFVVTNKVNPMTGVIIGTVPTLVAPAGTKSVRFTAQLLQLFGGGGGPHYDDMSLDQLTGNLPPSISSLTPNGTALFNLAASGITFTASSTTTNISPSGIKLILNGLDVSGGLSFVPGGSAASQNVTYSGLVPDRLYSAVVNVTDEVGFLTSATATFDTFVASNYQWEAEDYDHDTAQYFNNPTPTSVAAANSYFGLPGAAEIDYHEAGGWGGNPGQSYREAGVGPGVEWASDFARQKYVTARLSDPAVQDYDVGWVSGLNGDWMNYSRTIAAGTYNVYCRLASGDGGDKKCQLGLVTGGGGTASQTVSTLGIATFAGGAGWQAWKWAPLQDAGGNLVKLVYGAPTTVTFRVSADGCNMNFFMLAPARTDLPVIDNLYPTGAKPFEPGNTLSFTASSTVATIPTGNIHVVLDGKNVDSLLTIGPTPQSRSVSLPYLASNAMYSATITVTDSAGTTVSRALNFDTFSESNFSYEAEDYNYGGGQYIANPVLARPDPNNYYALGTAAIPDVDISSLAPAGGYGIAYSRPDPVGTEVTSDYLRQAYVTASVPDYDIGWDFSGTWFNYTRNFPAGNYWVYARLAGSGTLNAKIDLVTGADTIGQTTSALGTLDAVNPTGGWQSWRWVRLNVANGNPAVFSGGTKTLRYTTSGNVNHNFFMVTPAKDIVSLSIARSVNGQDLLISLPTQAGASYTMEYQDLGTTTWKLLKIVMGDGTTKTVTDPKAGISGRIYRAIIQ